MNPLVSVIIATYKREKRLREAILSVIKQTYNNIEIVVVNDNAIEKYNLIVGQIISKLKQQYNINIVYIENEVNKGSALTRNIGIDVSKGKYITFLDDDDIYLPKKIEKQVEFMLRSGADYSITDFKLYDEEENFIEKRCRSYIKNTDMKSILKYHLKYHLTGTDTLMFKRDYLLSIGKFPLIDIGDEFYLMEQAILKQGKFGYLNDCNVKAYVHSKTEGLSSGDGKVDGENQLYKYKKKYFRLLSKSDIRYIKMRHYAVLTFAELRRKKYLYVIKYTIMSVVSSPIHAIQLILNIKNH